MNNKISIQLKKVNKSHYRFLYDLLKERDPRINISHKEMPTYEEHVKFVMSKPYSKWYIIEFKGKMVGTTYLSKNNEIGIFIKKRFQRGEIGKSALEMLIKKNPRSRYLANINPKNKNSINFVKRNGFKLIQHTFELTTQNL